MGAAIARRIADGPRVAYGYMMRKLFAAVLEIEAVHQAHTAMIEDHLGRLKRLSKNAAHF